MSGSVKPVYFLSYHNFLYNTADLIYILTQWHGWDTHLSLVSELSDQALLKYLELAIAPRKKPSLLSHILAIQLLLSGKNCYTHSPGWLVTKWTTWHKACFSSISIACHRTHWVTSTLHNLEWNSTSYSLFGWY